jgi:pectinesterase
VNAPAFFSPRAAGLALLLASALVAACASPTPSASSPSSSSEPAIFKTVSPDSAADSGLQAAIDAVPADNATQKVILLEPGKYSGHFLLNKPQVTLRGSGADQTILTHNLGQAQLGTDGKPLNWDGSCTIMITGNDTTLANLTLENTHGKGMQALACGVHAERVAFLHCSLTGFQDTLKVDGGLQYFDHCLIVGAVDFIYGAATSYFDHCEIRCISNGYLTAPATPAGAVGLVFQDCNITFADPSVKVYLGRPWHFYPNSVFIHTDMGAGVRPVGWKTWNVPAADVRFAEYQSYGPGANNAGRANWATASDDPAPDIYSRAKVLGDWNPEQP